MESRGRNAPPVEGGGFLLQLLRQPSSSSNPPPEAYPNDALVSNFTHPYHKPPPFLPLHFFQRQNPNLQSSYRFPSSYTLSRGNFSSDGGELRRGFNRENPVNNVDRRHHVDPKNPIFGSVNVDKRGDGFMNSDDIDDVDGHLVGSAGLDNNPREKGETTKFHQDQDYSRSDMRAKWIMGQWEINQKSQSPCRSDIRRLDGPFLAVLESIIPVEEEKINQRNLLILLEKLITKEWPEAQLHLYGSRANSFNLTKSDIDICLTMKLGDMGKSNVLRRLADILQSKNLQNVKAITHARVPIVKLMDPRTGISCDICINNELAVVNTKLLRDYAEIDPRLRQLAFIVKHWAKSRGVNATYQGTLSSYAYVVMCIHFLQQRRPAILPCLQGMEVTYHATVGNVECAFYDQVKKLQNFGAGNGESIAELVWAFFHYWAYCHDYATDVISIRTGATLSKRDKGWTRRVGIERHLICIEDPFDVSHDLGRVVDRSSVGFLRQEFKRAAEIMQHNPNPCAKLFEPNVPF